MGNGLGLAGQGIRVPARVFTERFSRVTSGQTIARSVNAPRPEVNETDTDRPAE